MAPHTQSGQSNTEAISAKSLLRRGARERLWRGFGFILIAILIVGSAISAPSLIRVPFVSAACVALWFSIALFMLWYSADLHDWWKTHKKQINSGKGSEYDFAVGVYEILKKYAQTKRYFAYGTFAGATAILFPIAPALEHLGKLNQYDIGMLASAGSAIILGGSTMIAHLVLGVILLVLSYVIGRQLLPAEAVIERLLHVHFSAYRSQGDTSESINMQIAETLAKIKKDHPLWFRQGS